MYTTENSLQSQIDEITRRLDCLEDKTRSVPDQLPSDKPRRVKSFEGMVDYLHSKGIRPENDGEFWVGSSVWDPAMWALCGKPVTRLSPTAGVSYQYVHVIDEEGEYYFLSEWTEEADA